LKKKPDGVNLIPIRSVFDLMNVLKELCHE